MASVPVWALLLLGAAIILLVLLVAYEFGSRARQINALRVQREAERAAYAEWQARHGESLVESTPDDHPEETRRA